MASTINIPRPHLIMGLCLPLAVLLGYFLAEPMESESVAVVVLVLGVLSVPILMKWHHPLLILSWNACLNPIFLPGRPYLWMVMAFASLIFGVLNRAVNPDRQFVYIPSIATSLIFFAGVVVLTALVTGGFGVRSFGSARYGGRGYFYILASIAGYFALTSQRIPANRAGLYMAMFFLPGITGLMSNLAYALGPHAYFLYDIFPEGFAVEQALADYGADHLFVRIVGLTTAAIALYSFAMARYGILGVFDLKKPWRMALFLAGVGACLTCGFRTAFVMFLLIFAASFWLEGAWRTKLFPILIGLALVTIAIVAPQAQKLPLVAQRTLSFLPIRIDPVVKASATDSTDWRIQMWELLLPQVPHYLFKGKGYGMDPNDMTLARESELRGLSPTSTVSMIAGDYHNGPLSILIPFGIYGMIAFAWFAGASLRVLYRNYRFGDPTLRTANTFLLASFIAKLIFFLCVYGSLYLDFFMFTGIIGLSASLNGEPEPVEETAPSEEFSASFS